MWIIWVVFSNSYSHCLLCTHDVRLDAPDCWSGLGCFFFFSHARFFWFVYLHMFTLPVIYYFVAQHFSWFIDYTAHSHDLLITHDSHDLLLPHSAGVPKLPGLVNVYIAIVYMAQTFSRSHRIQPIWVISFPSIYPLVICYIAMV